MADCFLIRTNGGPCAGETHAIPRELASWPLPDVLPPEPGWPPGRYVKTSESQLPADVDDSPFVARGAEYEWRT